MPLFYKPLQSNIAAKDGNKKWHPCLVKFNKIVTTQKIGELIADKSSLTPGDVHNTIRNLMSVMRDQLMNSRTVKLDGLGTFTVIAKSTGNGVDKADDVTPSQIKNLKVQFTPEYTRPAGVGTTRAMYAGIEYERWNGNTTNGNGGNNENPDPDEEPWQDPDA